MRGKYAHARLKNQKMRDKISKKLLFGAILSNGMKLNAFKGLGLA